MSNYLRPGVNAVRNAVSMAASFKSVTSVMQARFRVISDHARYAETRSEVIAGLEDLGADLRYFIDPLLDNDNTGVHVLWYRVMRGRLAPAYHGGAMTCLCYIPNLYPWANDAEIFG